MLPTEAGEQHWNSIALSAAKQMTTVETQTTSYYAAHDDQADCHTSTRMAMTTRSRCRRRLTRSPIPFIQPYLWRSKACPWAAVVASTMVASASTHGLVTFPRMVQGARRIRGLRRIRLTFPAFAKV